VSDDSQKRPSGFSLAVPLLVLLVLVTGVSVLIFKGSSKATLPGGATEAAPGAGFYGTLALPAKRAPAIHLHDYLGNLVTMREQRGKVVFVTFLYTHCPDICPLIASNLRVALNMLGPRAADVSVIAVSVDPRGDTRAAVATFLADHGMTGRMSYLVGTAAELGRTWKAWGVGAEREAADPSLVAHSALVYGVSASGRLMTIYPDSFAPSQIVHDVPLLVAR